MKEFRLTLTLPLPEDKFAEAKLVSQIEEPLSAFLKALPEGAVVEHDVVTPRRKADEPPPAPVARHRPQAVAGE